jgi:hypothetical protein
VTRAALLLLAIALLAGCPGPEPDDDDATADDDDDFVPSGDPRLLLGEEVVCEAPVDGFDRFVDTAAQRGIDIDPPEWLEQRACPPIPGSAVAHDLEGDGDVDLLFRRPDSFPWVFVNDGDGGLNRLEPDVPSADARFNNFGALDWDGDDLTDLLLVGPGRVGLSRNLGDLQFAPVELLYEDMTYPLPCIDSAAWGDIDSDGDLDLVLPRLWASPQEDWVLPSSEMAQGTASLMLLNQGDHFTEVSLSGYDDPGLSFVGVFTDRDLDRDIDLILTSEFGPLTHIPPTSFFRNDGPGGDGAPLLTNDAPQVGVDVEISAMGFASADLNSDGYPDYCLTDVGTGPMCLSSLGGSGYVESAPSLGLQSELLDLEGECGGCWSMWSFILEDLDGDGAMDAAVVAAPPPDGGSVQNSFLTSIQPDAIWQGDGQGRFVERTYELDFNDTSWHFGMVTADLDRDGYSELVQNSYAGPPRILDNPCGEGTWLRVDLVGPPSNREGFGARIVVEAGGRSYLREMHGLHAISQQPSELRFGLGYPDHADRLQVFWADGATSTFEDVPANRRVLVVHPDLDPESL